MIKYITALLLSLLIINFIAMPANAYELFKGTAVDCSSGGTAQSAICKDKSGTTPVTGKNGIIYKITLIIAQLSGFAAIIMTIVASIKYITSRGDGNSVAAAKNTLVSVVVGLVIVALAASIITFVIGRVT
jgi:hypothetical protein